MPIYLKDVDVVPEVTKFQSALIVLCRMLTAFKFLPSSIPRFFIHFNMKSIQQLVESAE